MNADFTSARAGRERPGEPDPSAGRKERAPVQRHGSGVSCERRPHVLVTGSAAATVADSLARAAAADLRIEHAPAESFDPLGASLVVIAGEHARITQWLQRRDARQPTIAVVGDGRAGIVDLVDDFVVSREDVGAELYLRALRLLRDRTVDEVAGRLGVEMALRHLVGNAPPFLDVLRQIALYARADAPVLVIGETGTGKELCARALHHLGARRNFPFVAADCSALPDHLFENEMFGHAKGAYTDAAADQKGLVALSEHGTLLLDEIDSLSLVAQGKLLRFLQERTYRPLGSEKFLRSDVNVIAATNRDLGRLVEQKQFRTDLFYRLNVLQLRMLPLRERRGDIPLLARHFLAAAVQRDGRPRSFSPAALRKLESHDWPGNVRELANVVQRASVMAEGDWILPCDIALPGVHPTEAMAGSDFRAARSQMIESFERAYVGEKLAKHDGNISRAAREAGQERRAFGRLAKKYNLTD